MSPFDLAGKLALVTGSSRGLGFAFAEGLGRAGARVVLNARNADALAGAQARLREQGIDCAACVCDITSETAVIEAVERIEKESGPLEILVNNAGINLRAPAEQFPAEQWRQVLSLNLDATFYVSKAVGHGMIARRRGKVINIASLMSEGARPCTSAYAASKGAVKMLTKSLAVEWAKHNVQVNAIGPGYFITEMTQKLAQDKDFDSWVRSRTPAGRWGEPADLIGTLIYLASSASDFVTGQTIYVDGGWLAAL